MGNGQHRYQLMVLGALVNFRSRFTGLWRLDDQLGLARWIKQAASWAGPKAGMVMRGGRPVQHGMPLLVRIAAPISYDMDALVERERVCWQRLWR